MLWTACCLDFFGFMRAREWPVIQVSEFDTAASLRLEDIDPSFVQVRLKQSKTDPFRRGVFIYLGKTQMDLCPVVAILAYVAVLQHPWSELKTQPQKCSAGGNRQYLRTRREILAARLVTQ